MGDVSRIVECIDIRSNRILLAGVAKYPFFLKPGDVADLPEKGVHNIHAGTHQLLVREIADQSQGSVSSVCQSLYQLRTGDHDSSASKLHGPPSGFNSLGMFED